MKFTSEDILTSCLTVAGSGMGKSWGTLAKLVEVATNRWASVVLMDGHGPLARMLFLLLISLGLKRRVLYDQFSGFDRVLGIMALEPSSHPNLIKREAENDVRIKAVMDAMWRAADRKDHDSIHEMPMVSMYIELGLRLLMFQPVPLPLAKLIVVYQLDNAECARIVETCTDPIAKYEWESLTKLNKSVPKLVDDKISACVRLCRQVFTPALRERCEGSFDLDETLRRKMVIILDGSNDGSVSKQAASGIFGLWDVAITQTLQKRLTLTGKETPTIVVWEEAAAFNLISPFEIDMFREGRKAGLMPWIVTQDLGFATDEIRKAVKGNTKRHEYYNPISEELALEEAKDLAYRKLNPHRILRVRETERQRHKGFRPVTRVSKTKGEKGESETVSEGIEAEYETVKEKQEDLLPLNDQILLETTKLLSQDPGWIMFTQGKRVSQDSVYVEVPDDPYPEKDYPGLANKLFARAVAQSQAGPEFRTPAVVSEPTVWIEPTPEAPKPKGGKPKAQPGKKPSRGKKGVSA